MRAAGRRRIGARWPAAPMQASSRNGPRSILVLGETGCGVCRHARLHGEMRESSPARRSRPLRTTKPARRPAPTAYRISAEFVDIQRRTVGPRFVDEAHRCPQRRKSSAAAGRKLLARGSWPSAYCRFATTRRAADRPAPGTPSCWRVPLRSRGRPPASRSELREFGFAPPAALADSGAHDKHDEYHEGERVHDVGRGALDVESVGERFNLSCGHQA
jgi:hypothetical protein